MSRLVEGRAVRLVLSTCADAAAGEAIARPLVEERLAACVNIVPHLTSIYRWKGEIEQAGECLLLLKTSTERLDALATRLRELHPYEVPEMLVLDVPLGSADYLGWVVAESRGEP